MSLLKMVVYLLGLPLGPLGRRERFVSVCTPTRDRELSSLERKLDLW